MLIKTQNRSVRRSFRSFLIDPANRATKCDSSSGLGLRVRTVR